VRRKIITIALMFVDAAIVAIASCLAILTHFDGVAEAKFVGVLIDYLPIIIVVRLAIYYCFGLYNRLWRYASISELLAIIAAVTVSSGILTLYMMAMNMGIPKSIHILSWFFNIILIGASRLFIRVFHHLRQVPNNTKRERVLIVGAGDAGAMLARELRHRYYNSKELIGFVDDDQYKQDKTLFGKKVLGSRENIRELAKEHAIDEIIIAMPSISGAELRAIIEVCQQTGSSVKTLPGLYELIDGKITVQQLRKVELEDLLRRDPVELDMPQIMQQLANKRVLVTGAGGSIGSELCRQIARTNPAGLYLLGKGENSIYEIDRELREKYPKLSLDPIIADVRDRERINSIFNRVRPQIVFHAAAHKHVPLMERQPEEAVRNNVFGTQVVAEAADRLKCETFIMISTDKAVNPSSIMGTTKRVAEMIIQSLNNVSTTKFAAVRFGNVLGSRGSVVPLFRKQIAAGGPLTITHPDMRRYFMTIPEAAQLVLQAGAMAQGGEVFVLDMGEPIRIVDMACDLIRLSGYAPYKDIKIKFTGMRPGEKLFEELLTAEEGTSATKHAKIYQANLNVVEEATIYNGLVRLRQTMERQELIAVLSDLVATYKRSSAGRVLTGAKAGSEEEGDRSSEHLKPATLH